MTQLEKDEKIADLKKQLEEVEAIEVE